MFLRHKTVRLALLYVLLCGVSFAWSQRERYALCPDWRFAALRELMKPRQPPADVLFLGSSYTARGIVPYVVEETLHAAGGPKIRALNLAVNGTPRHANYLTLADWLEDHAQPTVVFVEVGMTDFIPYPHQMMPRFMDARDAARVVRERPYYWRGNRQYRRGPAPGFEPLLTSSPLHPIERASLHLELALEVLGRGPEDVTRMLFGCFMNGWTRFHGSRARGGDLGVAWAAASNGFGNPYFGGEPPITVEVLDQQFADRGWYRMDPQSDVARNGKLGVAKRAKEVSLEQALERRRQKQQDIPASPLYEVIRLYTREIAALCRVREVRLVFLYMPGFRDEQMSIEQEQFYREHGELFVPDLAVLWKDEELYQDTGHLTIEGARHLSAEIGAWLAHEYSR